MSALQCPHPMQPLGFTLKTVDSWGQGVQTGMPGMDNPASCLKNQKRKKKRSRLRGQLEFTIAQGPSSIPGTK